MACMALGPALRHMLQVHGRYTLVDHHQQGEFHHDTIVALDARVPGLGGVFVLTTNCNGGLKEGLVFDTVPSFSALWHARCPDNPEFAGTLPRLRASARTVHYFDPCALLTPDARSELKPAHRVRQRGGGWRLRTADDP